MTQKKGSLCLARDCGHLDAASQQCFLSHCHLPERNFQQKGYSSGSAASILAWSESMWLLTFPKTQIPPQRSSFWNFGQHPKGHDRPAEGNSTWRLPALLPGVGVTSPAVCGFPRELLCKGIMLICSSVNKKIYSTCLITFWTHLKKTNRWTNSSWDQDTLFGIIDGMISAVRGS